MTAITERLGLDSNKMTFADLLNDFLGGPVERFPRRIHKFARWIVEAYEQEKGYLYETGINVHDLLLEFAVSKLRSAQEAQQTDETGRSSTWGDWGSDILTVATLDSGKISLKFTQQPRSCKRFSDDNRRMFETRQGEIILANRGTLVSSFSAQTVYWGETNLPSSNIDKTEGVWVFFSEYGIEAGEISSIQLEQIGDFNQPTTKTIICGKLF